MSLSLREPVELIVKGKYKVLVPEEQDSVSKFQEMVAEILSQVDPMSQIHVDSGMSNRTITMNALACLREHHVLEESQKTKLEWILLKYGDVLDLNKAQRELLEVWLDISTRVKEIIWEYQLNEADLDNFVSTQCQEAIDGKRDIETFLSSKANVIIKHALEFRTYRETHDIFERLARKLLENKWHKVNSLAFPQRLMWGIQFIDVETSYYVEYNGEVRVSPKN